MADRGEPLRKLPLAAAEASDRSPTSDAFDDLAAVTPSHASQLPTHVRNNGGALPLDLTAGARQVSVAAAAIHDRLDTGVADPALRLHAIGRSTASFYATNMAGALGASQSQQRVGAPALARASLPAHYTGANAQRFTAATASSSGGLPPLRSAVSATTVPVRNSASPAAAADAPLLQHGCASMAASGSARSSANVPRQPWSEAAGERNGDDGPNLLHDATYLVDSHRGSNYEADHAADNQYYNASCTSTLGGLGQFDVPPGRAIPPPPAYALVKTAVHQGELTAGLARRHAVAMCRNAEKLLHRLTQPKQGWVDALPAMPKSAVKYSQAIAFMSEVKVGLGLGYAHGYGFLLVQLRKTGCIARWSAPAFFRCQYLRAGLSFGYAARGRVACSMAAQRMVDEFLVPHSVAGWDAAWLVEYTDGAHQLRARGHAQSGATVRGGSESDIIAEYCLADGAIMDVSVKLGRWEQDHYMNTALYGLDIGPADILSGAVAPLAEFMPLYQLLNSYSIESAI